MEQIRKSAFAGISVLIPLGASLLLAHVTIIGFLCIGVGVAWGIVASIAWAKRSFKIKQDSRKHLIGIRLNEFHETSYAIEQKIRERSPLDNQHLIADWVHEVHGFLGKECPTQASLFMGDFRNIEDNWTHREQDKIPRQIDEMIWNNPQHREAYCSNLIVLVEEHRQRLEKIMASCSSEGRP